MNINPAAAAILMTSGVAFLVGIAMMIGHHPAGAFIFLMSLFGVMAAVVVEMVGWMRKG